MTARPAAEVRNGILERWQAGASARLIARELGVSRSTVSSVLAALQANRNGDQQPCARARPSKLDAWQPTITSLLTRCCRSVDHSGTSPPLFGNDSRVDGRGHQRGPGRLLDVRYYFDTSAICRYYQTVPGSLNLEQIINEPGSSPILSWLTVLEMQSALAHKVRTGEPRRQTPGRL